MNISMKNLQCLDHSLLNGFFGMGTNSIDFAMAPYIALAFRKNYVQKSKIM